MFYSKIYNLLYVLWLLKIYINPETTKPEVFVNTVGEKTDVYLNGPVKPL